MHKVHACINTSPRLHKAGRRVRCFNPIFRLQIHLRISNIPCQPHLTPISKAWPSNPSTASKHPTNNPSAQSTSNASAPPGSSHQQPSPPFAPSSLSTSSQPSSRSSGSTTPAETQKTQSMTSPTSLSFRTGVWRSTLRSRPRTRLPMR